MEVSASQSGLSVGGREGRNTRIRLLHKLDIFFREMSRNLMREIHY